MRSLTSSPSHVSTPVRSDRSSKRNRGAFDMSEVRLLSSGKYLNEAVKEWGNGMSPSHRISLKHITYWIQKSWSGRESVTATKIPRRPWAPITWNWHGLSAFSNLKNVEDELTVVPCWIRAMVNATNSLTYANILDAFEWLLINSIELINNRSFSLFLHWERS